MTEGQKRLHTLLTDRAIAGLDARDQAEFEHLLAGAAIDPSYEASGAAIELALMAHYEPPPVHVEAAIVEQAGRYFGFTAARRHEATIGGPADADGPGPVDDDDELGDVLLGGPGPETGPGPEPDETPVRRIWEHSPSLDEALESGVLESSLTDGRIIRDASAADSQRAEIPRDLAPGPHPARRRAAARSTTPATAPATAPDTETASETASATAGANKPRSRPAKRGPGPAPAPGPAGVEASPNTVVVNAPVNRPVKDDFDDDDFGDDDFGDDDFGDDDFGDDDPTGPDTSAASSLAPERSEVVPLPVSESKLARLVTYASAFAAFIMLGIAVWLYVHRSDPPDPEVVRDQVEDAADQLEWTFLVKPDPAASETAAGTVVWSSELQQGVAVVTGLVINDPAESCYELWIVDSQRDAPVPAEVFDVTSEDELRVTIDSDLVIGAPKAFLITVERPGGVVVSKQDRLVMVAAPDPSP